MTPSLTILRTLALALPEATEEAHMGHPDFRVRGKIFATARTDDARGVLKLPPEIAETMIATHPEVFSPTPGAWGRRGWTYVQTDVADGPLLRDLVALAWRQVAPKRLIAAFAAAQEGLRPPHD